MKTALYIILASVLCAGVCAGPFEDYLEQNRHRNAIDKLRELNHRPYTGTRIVTNTQIKSARLQEVEGLIINHFDTLGINLTQVQRRGWNVADKRMEQVSTNLTGNAASQRMKLAAMSMLGFHLERYLLIVGDDLDMRRVRPDFGMTNSIIIRTNRVRGASMWQSFGKPGRAEYKDVK